jgi:hypothetical protein
MVLVNKLVSWVVGWVARQFLLCIIIPILYNLYLCFRYYLQISDQLAKLEWFVLELIA